MSRRVLVTGATGFIGRAACEELRRRGARVTAASSRDADLTDPAAARALVRRARPQVVLHAAGATRGDWGKLWDLHVGATINLASALPPGTRLVVAASAGEYGSGPGRRKAREDGPVQPITPYGATKLAQTLAALSFRHRGLEVAVGRVFNTIGPGQPATNVPGAWIAQLRGGSPEIRVGGLAAFRDFVDARDIARALADLCDPKVPGGIYNICSGRSVRVAEVLNLLLKLSGGGVKARQDAARKQTLDLPFSEGDPSKLRRATGWRPRYSLEESLRDALAA
jgi:GDP-4-dehydro-6-deoxy-D-mannose reductase